MRPDLQLQYHVAHYESATALLTHVGHDLECRPIESNIVYAHAFDLKTKEELGHTVSPGQFWLAVFSKAPGSSSPTLELVLSCTEHLLGKYPIFIYYNRPNSTLLADPEALRTPVRMLVQKLQLIVPPTRVFSVFSLKPITGLFVEEWSAATKQEPIEDDPWYSAISSFCTQDSVKTARSPTDPTHTLRLATLDDVDQCATLCEEFAATSPPFTLTSQRARKEAEKMIKLNQLWIYGVPEPQSPSRVAIACIVAVTRTTPTVAAVTKVYTTPRFRRQGFAERLLAHVTQHLLQEHNKHAVVLYVGHTLAARRVYDRLGFQGLSVEITKDGKEKRIDGADDWLEIGFTNVDIGHW